MTRSRLAINAAVSAKSVISSVQSTSSMPVGGVVPSAAALPFWRLK